MILQLELGQNVVTASIYVTTGLYYNIALLRLPKAFIICRKRGLTNDNRQTLIAMLLVLFIR